MKILVVDDNPTFLQQMKKYLNLRGYDTDVAKGGKIALKMMEEGEYDMVILDLKMPDLSGMEVMKWAKDRGVESDFLVVTGYGEVESAVEAMKMGALDYIQKPFNMEDLMKVIKEAEEKDNIADSIIKNLKGKSVMVISASPEKFEKRYGMEVSKKIDFSCDKPEIEKIIEMSRGFAKEKNAVIVLSDPKLFLKEYGAKNTQKYLKILSQLAEKGAGIILFYNSIGEFLMMNEIMEEPFHFMEEVLEAYKHPIRRRIINMLGVSPSLSYSEIMKKLELTQSSKLAFHLNKLLSLKLLEKKGSKYVLSSKGKKFLKAVGSLMEGSKNGMIHCFVKSI